ncbi:MAG: hypothetical protein RIF39_04385 [Cyclobacteriaceae bacterium]
MMNKYTVILFFYLFTFFTFLSISGMAQNRIEEKTKLNQIGMAAGNNRGYVKDLNFSALNYHETGFFYSLDYIRQQRNGKGLLIVDADVSLGKLKTRTSYFFTSNNTMANLEVAYLRKINLKNLKLETYVGGQFNTYLQILEWNDYESFSFVATHGIGLKTIVNFKLNSKNRFQTSLFLPLFQNLVHPPYNGIDETIIGNQDNMFKLIISGQPASLNKYLAFDWKLNYSLAFTYRFDWNVSYLVRYQNINEVNKFVHLQNQLTTGLTFNF